MYKLNVNGTVHSVDAEPEMPLLWVLREIVGLTGTKYGCGIAQCGACTVHVNGRSVKACTVLAVQADGARVTTIEGVASNGTLHPMQAAFREHHGLQCGFCTPGMIMSALDLVQNNPKPDEKAVRKWLDGNLCRCTGYHNIVKAIMAGAAAMAKG